MKSDWTYIAVIWTIIILASFIIIKAYAEPQIYTKKYTVELICAITDKAPYYNCNEKWAVVIHDMWAIQCLGDNYWTIGGCAVWDQNPKYKCALKYLKNQTIDEGCQRVIDNPILRNHKYIEISTITKDSYGNSLVWHELKHLICKCDWHKDLKASDPLEQFEKLKKA